MLTVGFLGNCQAQAMTSWTGGLTTLKVKAFPPVWLIKPEDAGDILNDISECDVLFSQRLGDEFSVPELRTSTLKHALGSKIVSWPNIYFDGYFPGLKYKYNIQGKIVGPLDDYHISVVEAIYSSGGSTGECADILSSKRLLEYFPSPITDSLSSLAGREEGLDVTISDYIATHLHRKRLFYSMNHPVNEVMGEMIRRLFAHIGERDHVKDLPEFKYPLDKIVIPVNPAVRKRFHIGFSEEDTILGSRVVFSKEGFEVTSERAEYDYLSLCECYYRIYDLIAKSE